MSKVYLEDSVLTDIADAIREKTGESGTITPAEMAEEIEGISGGGGDWTDDDIRTFVAQPTGNKIYSKDNIKLDRFDYLDGSSAPFFMNSNIKIFAPDFRRFNSTMTWRAIKELYLPSFFEIFPFATISGWYCDEDLSNETLEILDTKAINANVNGISNIKKLAVPYITNNNGYSIHYGSGAASCDYYWIEESKASIGGFINGIGTGVKNLILTRSTMVSMTSAPGSYMPNNNTVEHIFVPKALLEDYKGATNWSTYSEGKIVAIEDSEALLKGVFDGLDVIYDWWDGNPLIKKLIRMKLTQEWTITFNELVTIADDLRINGENSIYWKYKFFPVINKGLLIEQGKYLFVTDVFRYEDANGNKIPFSCLLCGREEFMKDDRTTQISPFSTPYAMNTTNTNEGGFYASNMRHILNDSDGALYLEIPSVIRNIAKDFRIDLNDDTKTVKFSILTGGEINNSGSDQYFNREEEKYYPLKIQYLKPSFENNISFNNAVFLGTKNKSNTTTFVLLRPSTGSFNAGDAIIPQYVVPTFGI